MSVRPHITVVYPAVDVRGPAADRLRTWTHGQTLARQHYRVIVGVDGSTQSQRQALALLLAPGDELFFIPNAIDAELWNAGAARASTPWLIFTEGHCLAHPDCLAAVARWITANPRAEVGNFAVEHDSACPLADLNRRWFAMMLEEWNSPGRWPRVQRAGFAIRAEAFKSAGAFDSKYSQFAPQLLSAGLHHSNVKVETVPGASVVHEDDDRMREHHAATADFVRGMLEAGSQSQPSFFERYFDNGLSLAAFPFARIIIARQIAQAMLLTGSSNWKLARQLISQMRPLIGALAAGILPRIIFHQLILALEDAAVDWLPLPARWRWALFARSHARCIQLEHLRRKPNLTSPCVLPNNVPRCPIAELPPESIIGVHELEKHQGWPLRWTEPIFLLRTELSAGENELRIETMGLRQNLHSSLIAVIVGGRALPPLRLGATADGDLIVRLPGKLVGAARKGILFVFSPLKTSYESASEDQRLLGLPIFSVASRSSGRPFELYGFSDDGWASPSTIIHAFEPTTASLKLEIPGWLPFKFPVNITAVQDGREIARIRRGRPGAFNFDIPIAAPGVIEISADQWLIPAALGFDDGRRICYRFASGAVSSKFGTRARREYDPAESGMSGLATTH